MGSNQKAVAAFVLSLLSGVFIILGGSVWCLRLNGHMDMGWMEGVMHGWEEHMHSWGVENSASYTIGVLGIVFGSHALH